MVYGVQNSESEKIGFIGLVQAIESGLNDIIFFAIAIWFLISLETRIKRRRAVAAVSEVEQLTTGLSRKIWQKIMILNQTRDMRLQAVDPVTSSQTEQPSNSKDKQAS